MARIILKTACCISGEPHTAGPDPIFVSESDAKILIQMGYASPCDPPAQKATKRTPQAPSPEP
jgi:hypothetical protein